MSWGRSKDGGLDFDVVAERKRRFTEKKYQKAKQLMFGNSDSAHTVTTIFNLEKVMI